MTVLEQFWKGDQKALATLISHVENQAEDYQKVLSSIYSKTGRAYKIGITGPPGVGKSSLVDKLTLKLCLNGSKVGIIAVDPTSPFSGGAFLGDRIRMQSLAGKKEVFIRSMASRGGEGGLAKSTFEVALVLDAFGQDFIILETVGVGQIEIEVSHQADTKVVVLTPESGDSIQALKAGLIEIGDVFVINKSDREGAPKAVAHLNMILDIKRHSEKWDYPVISTSAIYEKGIQELQEAILKHQKYLTSNLLLEKNRKQQIKNELKNILESKLRQLLEKKMENSFNWEESVDKIYSRKEDPYSWSEKIFAALKK